MFYKDFHSLVINTQTSNSPTGKNHGLIAFSNPLHKYLIISDMSSDESAVNTPVKSDPINAALEDVGISSSGPEKCQRNVISVLRNGT